MLDALFAPMSPEAFFKDYWTRNFLHIPGEPNKFSHYFPWTVLNKALEEGRFDGRRLGLVRAGKPIEASRFLTNSAVDAAGLVNELVAGATLVFNSCEEVHRPLRDLCEALERLVRKKVVTNLYAGWRKDNGFDTHWDTQDVLILQVAGRKRWKVWKPTRTHPFRKDHTDPSPATAPLEDPVWDCVLEPGGMLNIPRGWWHVANPLDEPCLHLTVTIENHNGIDFLKWLADSMKLSQTARMELPVVADQAERELWLARVKDDLLAAWGPDMIDRFLADQDAVGTARPLLSLPAEANPARNSVTPDTRLQLALARPIIAGKVAEGIAACQAGALKWDADAETAARLLIFNDGQPHTLAELSSSPDFKVQMAVGFLLLQGVLRRAQA